MSRVGKKPVACPSGVKVSVADRVIKIEGPKGKAEFAFKPELEVAWDEDAKAVSVTAVAGKENDREAKALWGTTRSIVQNMVKGVTEGYEKKLEIVGVGWGAQVAGQTIKLTLGFANTVEVPIPTGVTVTAEKQIISVSGTDKQAVGQLAAVIRSKKPPEPYNGKGIKYTTEVISRKQGKQFGK